MRDRDRDRDNSAYVLARMGGGGAPGASLSFGWKLTGGSPVAILPDGSADAGLTMAEHLILVVTTTGANAELTLVESADETVFVEDGDATDPGTIEVGTPLEIPFDMLKAGVGVGITLTIGGETYTFTFSTNLGFNEAFADLDDWTAEAVGSGAEIVIASGRAQIKSSPNQYARLHYAGAQIDARWTVITLVADVNQNNGTNCDFSMGFCFDDPATGEPNSFGSIETLMADGYGCLFRAGAFSERVARFDDGDSSPTVLRDNADATPATDDTQKTVIVSLTKDVDSVLIGRTYDGGALTAVDDTNALRKTGACRPFIAAFATGGPRVQFDNLQVRYSRAA